MDKKQAKTLKDALKALGKKNLALIIHGGSFPSRAGENTGFATQFNYDNINRAEVYLIDVADEEDKSKKFLEWMPDDLKLDKIPWWAWVGGAIICLVP